MSKVKEQPRKHKKRMNDSRFQKKIEKIGLEPYIALIPYLSHFSVHFFEWFKTWWVCQLGLYKTSFHSRSQDVMIKDFKLEILIRFNSLLIKRWILLHQTPCVFPIPLLKWTIFATNTPCPSHSFTEMSNFCNVDKHPMSFLFLYWNEQFLWCWNC